MPKAKKKKGANRATPYGEGKDGMDVDADAPAAPTFGFKNLEETKHEVFARHAGQWKTMKAKVAVLKRERKKIPKKGNKDKKKTISKGIRALIKELGEKQQKELKSYGITGGVAVPD